MMHRDLLADGAVVDFDPEFLDKDYATQLLTHLKDNTSWEQKQYTNWKTGKQYPQPRLTAWFAEPGMAYSYSGITQIVQDWTPELLELKAKIEVATGATYNSVLLNYYRSGKDSVGLHADDEKELGTNANIASVSLGQTRTFKLVRNSNRSETESFPLSHGSLLVMSGATQQFWKHEVAKDGSQEARINLTFRSFSK